MASKGKSAKQGLVGLWIWQLGEERGVDVARYREAQAELRVWENEAWIALESSAGFSSLSVEQWNQIEGPERRLLGDQPVYLRAEAREARELDGGGVVTRWSAEDGLHLAAAQIELDADLRARTPGDVRWMVVLVRRTLEDAYSFGTTDVDVERVDARLLGLDGTLIAGGVVEALPPARRASDGQTLYLVDATEVARLVRALVDAAEAVGSGPRGASD